MNNKLAYFVAKANMFGIGFFLIFKENGALIFKKQIQPGTSYPEIPIEKMLHGELYIIKIIKEKLKRADLWTKFIYY